MADTHLDTTDMDALALDLDALDQIAGGNWQWIETAQGKRMVYMTKTATGVKAVGVLRNSDGTITHWDYKTNQLVTRRP